MPNPPLAGCGPHRLCLRSQAKWSTHELAVRSASKTHANTMGQNPSFNEARPTGDCDSGSLSIKEENDSCHLKVPEQLCEQVALKNKSPAPTARSRRVFHEDQPPSPSYACRVLCEQEACRALSKVLLVVDVGMSYKRFLDGRISCRF